MDNSKKRAYHQEQDKASTSDTISAPVAPSSISSETLTPSTAHAVSQSSSKPKFGGGKIIVLVGLTGSGKSTFASAFIELMAQNGDHSWHRVSQDLLKTPKRVELETRRILESGDSVVIDRTNLSRELVRLHHTCMLANSFTLPTS